MSLPRPLVRVAVLLLALAGGPFPDAARTGFPTVQRYSDGSEAAWTEPALAGQGEPEHPAPVLSLAADAAQGGRGTVDGGVAPVADEGHGHTGDPGAIAPFAAIRALLTAVAGVVLGVRAARRTVSS